jgi:hypothetical protein
VANAGESERAIQLGSHMSNAGKKMMVGELLSETARGAHGPHRVRTGGADAHLVEVKKTGLHNWSFYSAEVDSVREEVRTVSQR